MSDVDVVIVNYKSAGHTVKCVAAAHAAARLGDLSIQVFVVNNGDDTATFEADVSAAGAVTVVNNTENVGFGAASNIGAALGNAPLIFFLNPDAVLGENALGPLVSFLTDPKNKNLAIVGPEIRDATGAVVASCSRVPSLADLFLRTIGLHRTWARTGYPYLPLTDHDHSKVVGQVMGAALMIRRTVFEQLNGFDEQYFLYYEDVDLSARVQALGFQSYYLKTANVSHVGRVSSSQNTGASLALHIRSRVTYAGQHFGVFGKVALVMASALIEFPARVLQAMLGKGATGLRGVLRAYKLLALNLFTGTALPKPGGGLPSQH